MGNEGCTLLLHTLLHLLYIKLQLAKEQPTVNSMPDRTAVKTDKAPAPLPVYSQAIVCNGMVYVSLERAPSPCQPDRSWNIFSLNPSSFLNVQQDPIEKRLTLNSYCSGQIGMDPETHALVDGGISDRTVRHLLPSSPSILIFSAQFSS